MNPLSCIIFDIDGTLTETNELIFATFNFVTEKYIQKVFTPSEITAMFGPTEEVVIENLIGRDRLDDAVEDYFSFYETHHPKMADAYKGIREVLEHLKSQEILLAVFTGKGKRAALITLEKIGIKGYFDIIVTGNDVNNHKPSAEGIRKVMTRFELLPHEVLMVGDSIADVKAARDAGVTIAAVLWDSYCKEKVMEMKPDYFFHSVDEFSDWLKKMISPKEPNTNVRSSIK
ncbi:MAG TPA: HAD-IA family hydrolase [Bacteroidota bacterium]|nr:HAD-IA family hydrolase [Bacteroidota bacterium]